MNIALLIFCAYMTFSMSVKIFMTPPEGKNYPPSTLSKIIIHLNLRNFSIALWLFLWDFSLWILSIYGTVYFFKKVF